MNVVIGKEQPGMGSTVGQRGSLVDRVSEGGPTLQEFPTCRPMCSWTRGLWRIYEGNGGHLLGMLGLLGV